MRSAVDDTVRMRIVLDFIDGCNDMSICDRQALIDDEPQPFDPNWDAFLAALADHVAFEGALRQPRWAEGEGRFLAAFWFPVDLPSVRPEALATSPATFMRHGILITPDLFARA